MPRLASESGSGTSSSDPGANGTGPNGTGPSAAANGVPSHSSDPVRAPVLPVTDRRGTPLTASSAALPKPAQVAPLHGLKQADLLIVAPFSLPSRVDQAVSRLPGVTSAEPVEAAKVKVNGAYAAVLGVNPSTFRGYAARPVASSNALWQGVANGGIAVSYGMGTLDKLKLGGPVAVTGRTQQKLPVVAYGTVGIAGVDAVVSAATATSLGMPASNAMVLSAQPADVSGVAQRIRKLLPHGAAVEQLLIWVTHSTGGTSTPVGAAAGNPAAAGSFLSQQQLTAVLQAAISRRGLPYVWGGAGPSVFDCSGLVQWAFAQAGLVMPRVAADQALTGPAVPVSQLIAGDLLFYRTDPTDPGYISHVAMYVGNGWMIQAPEPGQNVELVPVDVGAEFAGAVRVDPSIASQVAAGIP